MSEESRKFETWEEVIRDFLESKKIASEEDYLKDRLKEIGAMYGRQSFFEDENIELLFDTKKSKKGRDQTAIDFQRDRFRRVMALPRKPGDLDERKEVEQYQSELRRLSERFDAWHWLNENCKNASSVSFATHVIKLTHSSIDGSSFFDEISCTKDDYLTTSCLKEKVLDGAVRGNQYAPIYQFLELGLNEVKLASTLRVENSDTFNAFAKDENEAREWREGFGEALTGGQVDTIKSHILAKQIYFPVNGDNSCVKYHLLCIIKSSSLAQSIYEKTDNRNDPTTNQRKNGKYSNRPFSYTSKAILNVTASNHGNASQLNGKRGGRLKLLSCEPPIWEGQLKPPITHKSVFGRSLYLPAAKEDIDDLRGYLLCFDKLGLSTRTPERLKRIETLVNSIADKFFDHVVRIQKLPAGWTGSEGIALKREHQYLLDPFRQNEQFQAARKAADWQPVVCDDFGWWLNARLRGKNKQFTPQAKHRRMWAKLLEVRLRENNDMVEAKRARVEGGEA